MTAERWPLCNHPKCSRPASDDDKYMDGVGNTYCGVPCMMNHGTWPNVECPRCNQMAPENIIDIFNGVCDNCYQDLVDDAAQERYERRCNPDYDPNDFADLHKWSDFRNVTTIIIED